MRKYILSIPLMALLLMVASCKMATLTGTSEPPPPKQVPAPEVISVPQHQSPDDIKLVTAALMEALRGGAVPVENVTFDPAGQHSVNETGFFYEEFDAYNVSVTGYEVSQIREGAAQALLEGVILFKDVLNRRAAVYYAAQYTVTQTRVTITKSVIRGIPSDFPRVETFFVPEKKLRGVTAPLTSFADYYLFAIENAEPMHYNEGESKTGIKDKYVVMAFCKDRLFDESSLTMTVTDKALGAGKKLGEAISLNDSGWRILMAGGEFAPGSSRNKFFVTVSYKQEAASHLPHVVVGDYRNVKSKHVEAAPAAAQPASGPAPALAPPPPGSAPAPAPAPAPALAPTPGKEGPLALGQAFLNPVFPEDVEVIQARLKALGLYTGKIDRDFGPLTKRALDRFNVKHGFPKGQWGLDVQKALFKGTGL
ncbi:MAG: peptidoglycan-binding protein [Desulfovibrionaceae bacterium]|nr:peptidoglycan-binding protein [Desulfovibrionaceae bacterium]